MPSTHGRRQLLATTALLALSRAAFGRTISGALPWSPNEVYPPPDAARPGPWLYLTADEARAVEAIADRLIPADDLGPGGREAGCAVFIDRQLAGPYGSQEWLYRQGPFHPDAPANFGPQSPITPRERYRAALAALDGHCRGRYAGKPFAELPAAQQDEVLTGLEKGQVQLQGTDGRAFFTLVHTNVVEGFFADPIYGGNRDMCGWKLVGFPGVRYDFRDVIANPNQPYTLPPVSLQGRRPA
ncbi:gluconate 2-dehydrogenase subunit 3 family protein [Roseomonas sp. NAR14]|uniref:Gluconate 2-dehydrogenase subunit 3 family protein n=1 Tax=Roseomonas acroporae TaxID=2937791 RepID=A0A9X1YCY1_9PROT|nr:gluconate 2-dehydrogenase subunit 3 family protein [Roseomonas acroporae]MCK8787848.1 gluconate 2-dehydrogenase subunit 3 family protein [Roseomonas acroporae]